MLCWGFRNLPGRWPRWRPNPQPSCGMTHQSDFAGKTALVTGASRGLGHDIALELARRGAKVACVATEAKNAAEIVAEITKAGGTARPYGARVQEGAQVDALFDAVEKELGTVDILVNNAGIARPKPILEMDENDYDAVMDINARGVFLCSKRAALKMREGGGGAIIHIGSIAGLNAFPNRLNYCASKAAVHHMARVMAIEWAPLGIRVNCVAPGYIRTPLLENLMAQGIVDEAALSGRVPQKKLGQPMDIAQAVCFLAGSESQYITGSVLTVDGGWDAYGFI